MGCLGSGNYTKAGGRTHLASPLLLWGSHCLTISLSLSLPPVPCFSFPCKCTLCTLHSFLCLFPTPFAELQGEEQRTHVPGNTAQPDFIEMCFLVASSASATFSFKISELILHFTSAWCSVSSPQASQSPGGKDFLILMAETSFQRQELS